jgi:hypothetical protein
LKSFGGAKFWTLIADDLSGYCWIYFLKQKNDLSIYVARLIKELRNKNMCVKILRMYNAGENYAWEKACNIDNFSIKVE